jgi:bifunctional non-homologous end joining protein LigD
MNSSTNSNNTRLDTKFPRFVVHEHHASHLHFDFRLEMAGVLKSWALPKGPSLDSRQKRLAVAVEDHDLSFIDFQGHIHYGQYGAGDIVIWDSGTYESEGDSGAQLAKGKLSFTLHGKKLQGKFTLIRLANNIRNWLLIKNHDEFAVPNWELMTVMRDKR